MAPFRLVVKHQSLAQEKGRIFNRTVGQSLRSDPAAPPIGKRRESAPRIHCRYHAIDSSKQDKMSEAFSTDGAGRNDANFGSAPFCRGPVSTRTPDLYRVKIEQILQIKHLM